MLTNRPARLLIVIAALLAAILLLRSFAPEWLAKAEPRYVMQKLESLVALHGYKAIFLGALIEGMLLVSWYFPGSTIVLVGALLAGRGILSLPLLIAVASAGFLIGYVADFFVGRHGWAHVARYVGLEKPLRRMEERVATAHAGPFILLFAHPHCAVLAATAAGVLHRPAHKIFPLICGAAILWTSVWAGVAFIFGRFILDFINGPAALVAFVGVALVFIFSRNKTCSSRLE